MHRLSWLNFTTCSGDQQTELTDLLPTIGGDIKLGPWHLHSKCRGSSIIKRQALPRVGDPVTIREAGTGSGTIPSEKGIVFRIVLGQIRDQAVVRCVLKHTGTLLQTQVIHSILMPTCVPHTQRSHTCYNHLARSVTDLTKHQELTLPKRLPVEGIDRSGPQHGPHGHLISTSVRGGDNTKVIVPGHT